MQALPLFDQTPADELAASKLDATSAERRVYDVVRHYRGWRNPVSIKTIHGVTGLSDREIKGAVSELVMSHRILIGGRRQQPVGYFMVETAEDADEAARPYEAQIITELRRLRKLKGKLRVREFLGQQVVDLETEEGGAL